MDAKAHRKEGIFEVKSVHAEKHFTPDDEYNVEFKNALDTFACWHGTPDILFCGSYDDGSPSREMRRAFL